MKEQLRIRIYPDGKIEAATAGIKGKACLSYVRVLERMLDAATVDSSYTEEYYQQAEQHTQQQTETVYVSARKGKA